MPSEAASRFHFARDDGTIGHVTLEPDVQQRLAAGEAGIIAFMGHNGLEHAVVPADLARDIAYVKPEWLRSLAGVTDVDTSHPTAPAESIEAAVSIEAVESIEAIKAIEAIVPEATNAVAPGESEPS